jgi:hypothetical protein
MRFMWGAIVLISDSHHRPPPTHFLLKMLTRYAIHLPHKGRGLELLCSPFMGELREAVRGFAVRARNLNRVEQTKREVSLK